MSEQSWIDVAKKTPKFLEPVQVAIRKIDGKLYVREGFLHKSGEWSVSGWYDPKYDVITHWKPLSEPPVCGDMPDGAAEGAEEKGVSAAEIKIAAKKAKVHLWQVADRMGIHDSMFSRKLRRTLSKEEADDILAIIDERGSK